METGQIPTFKIFDISESTYYDAVPSEDIPWAHGNLPIIDNLSVFRDCNDDLGGTAEIDSCGDCTGGNTDLEACVQDCNGVWGGTDVYGGCDN